MPPVGIYLDESGDDGWVFDKPYRQGGSSRYLTLGAVLVPSSKKHLLKRVVKSLYKTRNWKIDKEKKWSEMIGSARAEFARLALKLIENHNDIKYFTIVVKKENVEAHIRREPNKLYNWMTRLLLAEEMAKYGEVSLIPDNRSIKVESGNSLHDYLQVTMWFELKATTHLKTEHMDSANSRNVQFADMLAGLVQSYHEDKATEPYRILGAHIQSKTLFFK